MGTLTLTQAEEPLKVSPLTLIFLRDGNKVLTLKRAAHKMIHPNKLSGFGGKVEPGEDLFDSARSEFLEETGLTLKKLTLKGTIVRSTAHYLNFVYLFLADGFEGTLKERDEEGMIAWMDKEALLKDPELVEHLKLYLEQILEPTSDFFCAVSNEDQTFFASNEAHFNERAKAHKSH